MSTPKIFNVAFRAGRHKGHFMVHLTSSERLPASDAAFDSDKIERFIEVRL